MASQFTRADSLREYLSGAASDGGVQTVPNLSLGNYRSSTEAASRGIYLDPSTAINSLTINFASGANNTGQGQLLSSAGNILQWQDAGGTLGPAQIVSNGLPFILESGENPACYLRVTSNIDTLETGTSLITLSDLLDNLFGFEDVTDSQATAGEITYRASFLLNVSASNVSSIYRYLKQLGIAQVSDVARLGGAGSGVITTSGSFADWPANGWCRIETSGGTLREIIYYASRTTTTLTVPAAGRARLGTANTAGASSDNLYAVPGLVIGLDPTGVITAAAIQSIANEVTAPIGVSWFGGVRADATGLSIGSLNPNQMVGIWMKRDTPAGMIATTVAYNKLLTTFSA